jgi:hypothetical protein
MSKKLHVTMPISDTIPGPGTYHVTIIETEKENEIPAVETKDSIEHFGHGTAEDIHSVSHPAED